MKNPSAICLRRWFAAIDKGVFSILLAPIWRIRIEHRFYI